MRFYFYPINVKMNGGIAWGIHFCFDGAVEVGLIWWNLIIAYKKENKNEL